MVNNANQLAKPETQDILNKLMAKVVWDTGYQPFGDGHSAQAIEEAIKNYMGNY